MLAIAIAESQVRMVTHLEITAAMIQTTCEVIRAL
jgi:hypothetical protein